MRFPFEPLTKLGGHWRMCGAAALAVYFGLMVLGEWSGTWIERAVSLDQYEGVPSVNHYMTWVGIIAYGLLLAVPFVPGVEIGLALLMIFGCDIAVQVYVASVVGLSASYLVGHLVPSSLLASFFERMGLDRAAKSARRVEPLAPCGGLGLLSQNLPGRLGPALVRWRYVALALVLNLPGNAVLGGGGGIAMLAGLSGMFSFSGYFVAISLAVLPVPLAVVLVGWLM